MHKKNSKNSESVDGIDCNDVEFLKYGHNWKY